MTFAATNRILVGLKEESTYAVYPAGNLLEARYASESFGQTSNSTVSNEVLSNRMVPDIIRTGVSATGGYNGEISYGVDSFEKLVKGVLGAASDFGAPPARLTGEIQAVASTSKLITDSTGAGVDFSGISVGDWIRTTGFQTATNNGYWQVSAVDTGTATAHEVTLVGGTLTDEAAGAVATQAVQSSAAMRNGIAEHSFSIEKQWQDVGVGGLAARILGYRAGGVQLGLTPEAIATFQISGQGRNLTDTAGNDFSDGTVTPDFTTLESVTAAAANSIMNTVDGIGQLIINRDAPFSTVTVQNLTVNPQTALRRQTAIGSGIGVAGIGIGRLTVSGSLTAYFEDPTLLTRHLLFTDTDLAVVVKDQANNAYLIDIPAVKLDGDGLPKGTGNDQDALISVNLNAKRSTRLGLDYQFAVHKFVAPS